MLIGKNWFHCVVVVPVWRGFSSLHPSKKSHLLCAPSALSAALRLCGKSPLPIGLLFTSSCLRLCKSRLCQFFPSSLTLTPRSKIVNHQSSITLLFTHTSALKHYSYPRPSASICRWLFASLLELSARLSPLRYGSAALRLWFSSSSTPPITNNQ